MKVEEIREKYPPQVVETQIEFERIMSEMNAEQTHMNHPYLDRDREIAVQREQIKVQIQALHTQDSALKLEKLELEAKRKEINRVFHDLKHELIMLNPAEKFVKDKVVIDAM